MLSRCPTVAGVDFIPVDVIHELLDVHGTTPEVVGGRSSERTFLLGCALVQWAALRAGEFLPSCRADVTLLSHRRLIFDGLKLGVRQQRAADRQRQRYQRNTKHLLVHHTHPSVFKETLFALPTGDTPADCTNEITSSQAPSLSRSSNVALCCPCRLVEHLSSPESRTRIAGQDNGSVRLVSVACSKPPLVMLFATGRATHPLTSRTCKSLPSARRKWQYRPT